MTLSADSVTDWISALSTLLLGVLGIVFSVAQFVASGFRPKTQVQMGRDGDSMRISVSNRGRAEGIIHGLEIVDRHRRRIELDGAGATFAPVKLAAKSAHEFVFTAPEGRDFTALDTVVVYWGAKHVRKTPLPVWVSFYPKGAKPGRLVS